MAQILIVDDEPDLCRVLAPLLRQHGHAARGEASGDAALAALRERRTDLALLDLRMDGMDGLETLARIRSEAPSVLVVMVTAFGGIEAAVTAMKMGAVDFVAKPFDNAGLLRTIDTLLAMRRGGCEGVQSAAIGESGAFRDAIDLALKFAVPDINILLFGETGTGKEVFAGLIHRASKRAAGPFVAVDCSVLPAELIESELFGHEKGAFTGATASRIGRFEAANGGMLFLDEVGNLSLAVQAKLLRVLQERRFCRVGSSEPCRVDLRVVAATNVDLRAAVDRGTFRRDLYYRLDEITIELPPLRKRRDDVRLLAEHFVRADAAGLGRPVPTISGQALEALEAWSWPGNVRELKSAMKIGVVLAGRAILVDHLPVEIRGSVAGASGVTTTTAHPERAEQMQMDLEFPCAGEGVDLKAFGSQVAERAERALLEAMLRREPCSCARLAQMLRVDPKTLRAKLRRYGLERRVA